VDLTIPVSLVILIGLVMLGVPIPFAFFAALVFLVATHHYDSSFLLPCGFAKLNSVILLAIPLFIGMGAVIAEGSIAERLVDLVTAMAGRIPASLGIASVVVSSVFGSISGAAVSSIVCIGKVMIPQMEAHGYSRGYSTALISSAAVLSTLIPPSMPMILFAYTTQQSVAACFLATLIPGIILTALFSIANVFLSKKMPIREEPKLNIKDRLHKVGHNTKRAAAPLVLPFIILGGIYGGVMTPTEAAAMGLLYVIFVSTFIYREVSVSKMLVTLRACCSTSGSVLLITFFAVMLSRIYTMEQVPQQIASMLLGITTNKVMILLLVNLFLVIIGLLMDEMSGILLTAPLLFPVMTAIGVHPVHLAAILGCNLGMGMMTPPVAIILYVGAHVGGVTIDKMMKTVFILILFCSLPVILLTTFWPGLSLFLPGLAGLL
jgi:C4-dicarboxylate transporter DctM subunit